jgi:hypothetical protein
VAIAQSAPVYMDKRASLAKALDLIQQAAKQEAQLVAFGETWLPGYPAWLDVCPGAALWENASAKEVFARLRNNSITVPGEEVTALRCSQFQTMDNSKTTIGSSSPRTPNGSSGEMAMDAEQKPSPHPRGVWAD